MSLKNGRELVIVIAMVAGLAGCRTAQAPLRSDAMWIPPKWEQISKTSDAVWADIRERRVNFREPLALIELIDIALKYNPSTKKAWEDARVQETKRKQAEAAWYPEITASADISAQRQNADHQIDDTNNYGYGPELKLTYMVLDLGGRMADIKEATYSVLSANFTFNRSMQDLILDVEEAYYGLYSAAAQVAAAEDDAEDAGTALTAARQKFDVGLVAQLDVYQAESTYDDALYNLEDAKGKFLDAKGTLAETIGFPADTDLSIVPPAGALPTDISKEDVRALIEAALIQRPDIAAVRADLVAKEAAIVSANSSLWPTVNLEADSDVRWYEYYGYDKRDGNYYGYSGFVNIEWDFFDGFKKAQKKRQAENLRDKAREALIQAELEASGDVWTKYHNYNTSVKKLKYSEAFLKSSEEAYRLALDGYEVGLKSILDLLDAQSKLSDARSKHIQSKKDLFFSIAELAHATGTIGMEGGN
ncbi:MAG: TolC family protein [Candidatus Omnitrophota bacterium]